MEVVTGSFGKKDEATDALTDENIAQIVSDLGLQESPKPDFLCIAHHPESGEYGIATSMGEAGVVLMLERIKLFVLEGLDE